MTDAGDRDRDDARQPDDDAGVTVGSADALDRLDTGDEAASHGEVASDGEVVSDGEVNAGDDIDIDTDDEIEQSREQEAELDGELADDPGELDGDDARGDELVREVSDGADAGRDDESDGLVSRLRVIGDQPLAARAEALGQVHDELRAWLEAGDGPQARS